MKPGCELCQHPLLCSSPIFLTQSSTSNLGKSFVVESLSVSLHVLACAYVCLWSQPRSGSVIWRPEHQWEQDQDFHMENNNSDPVTRSRPQGRGRVLNTNGESRAIQKFYVIPQIYLKSMQICMQPANLSTVDNWWAQEQMMGPWQSSVTEMRKTI